MTEPTEVQVTIAPAMETSAENAQTSESVAEVVTETAVEIATIEAQRDVAIAVIHAETEQQAIEANAEHSERIVWLEARNLELERANFDLNQRVSELTQQQPQEAEAAITSVTATTMSGTAAETLSETLTEALESDVVESPAAEAEAIAPPAPEEKPRRPKVRFL